MNYIVYLLLINNLSVYFRPPKKETLGNICHIMNFIEIRNSYCSSLLFDIEKCDSIRIAIDKLDNSCFYELKKIKE